MDQKRPGGEMKSTDWSAPTKSQLLPLGSTWQELLTKPYFVPAVVVALGLAAMFATLHDLSSGITVSYFGMPVTVPNYYLVVALLLTAGGAYAVYRMVGKSKSWWLMPVVMAFTAFLAMSTVMGVLQQLFSLGQPASGQESNVLLRFVYNMFRAGLPEESLKAIPVAIGVYIGFRLMSRLGASHPARQLAVLEPLDGILIGAASGFGFAFAETVFQYVPQAMVLNSGVLNGMAQLIKPLGYHLTLPDNVTEDVLIATIVKMFKILSDAVGYERATFEFHHIVTQTQSAGLELMLPRLVGNVFGHSAYAGIFGYFIGLATLKPANRAKTVLTGLLIAAALHATWNATAGSSTLMSFLVSLAAFTGLAVVTIKARQISPERSQLMPSQILDRGRVPATPSEPMPRPAPAPAAASVAPSAAPVAAAPARPPGSVTWDDDSNLRLIEIGTARIPATLGARLYERQAPGAHATRGDGVVAEVTTHPNDPAVLGLKNLSGQPWNVTLASGEQRELAPGRSIRLEAGLSARIGDLLARIR
jgi:RsiW-degrading membrane proteinase PrsW (M82 family)